MELRQTKEIALSALNWRPFDALSNGQGSLSPPTLYQQMVQELLQIDEYTENIIALGSNIPLETIRRIHKGELQSPGDIVLGRLLRFYNQTVCAVSGE
jgi:hypothetical protein